MSNITEFNQQLPQVVSRGIDEPTWLTLKQSIYPGAKDESVLMVLDYCKSRDLDPLMKPVHIVPMSIKGPNGQYGMQDVVMPGINTYRIQASRSGDLAGISAPVFGNDVIGALGSLSNFSYPEWCEITVTKMIGDRLVTFVAKEYFTENYATKKRGDLTPNAMWQKRPKGQLSKCAEAQALRKGWPEIGQQPTYEEMVGKETSQTIKDVTPSAASKLILEATESAQEIFDAGCDWIDIAENLGELQAKYAESYRKLKEMGANNELASLVEIYNEKKAYLGESNE